MMLRLSAIVLFGLLAIQTSSRGQTTTQNSNGAADDRESSIAEGETVFELAKAITSIIQDKNGAHWFASAGRGVYRYDGKTITNFTVDDGLCDNHVHGMQRDRAGNLYFSSSGAISKFDGRKFTTLTIAGGSGHDNGWRLRADDLWFGGSGDSGAIYRYDGDSLHRLEFPRTKRGDDHLLRFPRSEFPNARNSPYDVYTIYKDRSGAVWFGTAALGVCRYDGKSFDWLYEDHLTNTPGGGSFGIRSIIEDKDGKFWFCNTLYRYNILPKHSSEEEDGLILYKREDGVGDLAAMNEETPLYFAFVVEGDDGHLWMGTYGDVWRYDGKNITRYPIGDDSKTIWISSLYKDSHGDIWIGAREAGAYKFNGKTFERFAGGNDRSEYRDPYFTPTEAKSTSYMPRVIIRNIREDRYGNIWFSTFGGPIRYDGKDFTNFGEEVGLATTRVFSMVEARSGALWFGSITGGASYYNGKSFINYTEKDGLGSNDVSCIFEDRDANIWFATGNGASRCDAVSLINFTTKDGLVHDSVHTIAQDAAGRIWFGTQGGICSYDGKAFSNLADQVGRSFVNIRSIVEDRSGNLWFGGEEGAFRYDGKALTKFTVKEGLLSDFVGSMIVDRAGNIWFGHPGSFPAGLGGGASRYDGERFEHFTRENGLGSDTVYAMLEDKAGNIWFGSADAGASRWDGETFTNFSANPNVTNVPR
jgi:ligand-binding sensor domain-containing protein